MITLWRGAARVALVSIAVLTACTDGAAPDGARATRMPSEIRPTPMSSSQVATPLPSPTPKAGTSASPPLPLPADLADACTVDGTVFDVLHRRGVFYLAGDFAAVSPATDISRSGRMARRNLAACDAATGDVLKWYPEGGVDGPVRDLATDGRWLYIAGEYERLGDTAVANLGRVALRGGQVDPDWTPNPNAESRTVKIDRRGRILVGGVFGKIAGERQAALARLMKDGSLDTSFQPELAFLPNNRPGVFALAIDHTHSSLYLGGKFRWVNGRARSSAASVDLETGTTTLSFAPRLRDPNPEDPVVQVIDIMLDDELVYLCGDWWQTEGEGTRQRQRDVSRFNAVSGAADQRWTPTTDGGIQACALDKARGVVVVGGHFDTINGKERRKLAAVSATDGAALSFTQADSVSGVWAIELLPEGRIALGGEFAEVGGVRQPGFAVLRPAEAAAD